MLNEVDPAVNRSTANGSTTVFPYTFLIYDQTEIEVLCDTTVKTLTTDYTVSGVGVSGGGNITFVSAPANGIIVTRMRKQPAQQQSDYIRNEAQPSERIEQDLDKLAMMVQQVKEVLRRMFALPKSSSVSNQTIDDPVEGFFARAKTGGGIDWATPTNASPAALPISIANGGTGQTTAALARTALDVPSTGTVTAQIAAAASISDSSFRIVGSSDATKKAAFEVDGITTGTTRTFTVQNRDGTLALTADLISATVKSINGLTYSNGTDATNDLNINTGGCMDATGAYWMNLSTALGKQSDVAWAVGGTIGTPLGGLDTGAVGNNDYYIWLIARSDTGVVDALYSLSSTAPTMPASYDYKRLIGWFKRVGGTVVQMTTYETAGGGLELNWTVPTLDVNLAATLTTAGRTDAVKVPQNFSTIAHLNVQMKDAGSGINPAWVYNPDTTSAAPSLTVAPLGNMMNESGGSDAVTGLRIRTSATGTIGAIALVATVDTYRVVTLGFEWARRN